MVKRDKSERAQLKLRLPEPIRARLEKEAEENGYSLNWEVVRRVDQSIKDEYLGKLLFGNRDIFNAAYLFAGIMDALERKLGKSFADEPEIFTLAVDAIQHGSFSILAPGAMGLEVTGRALAGTREVFDIAARRAIERRARKEPGKCHNA